MGRQETEKLVYRRATSLRNHLKYPVNQPSNAKLSVVKTLAVLTAGSILLSGCAPTNTLDSVSNQNPQMDRTVSTAMLAADVTPIRQVNWIKEANVELIMRDAQNDGAKVLKVIPKDTALQVTHSQGRWAKVVYEGVTGWVPAGWMRDMHPRKVNWKKETNRSMKMLVAPSDSASLILNLPKNAPVTVTHSYDRWAKVSYKNSNGWVPAGWLRDSVAANPSPAPSPSPSPSPSPTPTPMPKPDPKPEAPSEPAIDAGILSKWGSPDLRDEFTYVDANGKPAIDPSIWNVRGRDTLGLLPDMTVVDKGQVSVDKSGIAHLKADWLDKPVSASTGPAQRIMKTGYMDMRKLRSTDAYYGQQYGRWEIRAKVPTAKGTSNGVLAAFWLRNNNSGEIDIMEAWGSSPTPPSYQKVGTSTTTIHTETSGKNNQKEFWVLEPLVGATKHVSEDFHTWALEYTPDRFAMYYDGKLAFETTPKKSPNLWGPSFQSPMHVRLNLHMGMSEKYFGLPDLNNKQNTQNSDFQVDYVRVWDMKK